MTPRIALFANQGSAQLTEIAAAVSSAGGEPVSLDIRVGAGPAVAYGGGVARWGDEDLSDVGAVHIRCTAPRTLPVLPPVLTPAAYAEYRAEFLREQAYNAATVGFFEHLAARGVLVVNRLTAGYVDHDSKGQFYPKLAAAGFAVPRTLSTTCPDSAAAFLDEVGEAVIKPAIGVGSTRLVTADDRARLDELTLCPALFQERIEGPTIRIHVVGDAMVLALRILSEGLDSRTGSQSFEPMELAGPEALAVVRATRFLGLHYAAWDAMEGADGRLRLLDCNPGPFVMWLPEPYRRTVFGALARYLVAGARAP